MTDEIKRVEELVETISNCHATIPSEIVGELNDITGNEWTEDDYLEYCAEYWSRSCLEETVYALFHGGEYPENIERSIYIWKPKSKIDLPDVKIMFGLRKACRNEEQEFLDQFEKLDTALFIQMVKEFFKDWNVSKEEERTASIEIEFQSKEELEYGMFQYVTFSAHHNKMIELFCCNVPREEMSSLTDRICAEGVAVFEK